MVLWQHTRNTISSIGSNYYFQDAYNLEGKSYMCEKLDKRTYVTAGNLSA